MLQVLCSEEDPLLGKLKETWVRFEVQGRGSLHVHVLLWLEDPAEVRRVADEVIGSLPCRYTVTPAEDPDAEDIYHPIALAMDDPSTEATLTRIVRTKQVRRLHAIMGGGGLCCAIPITLWAKGHHSRPLPIALVYAGYSQLPSG